MANKRNRQKQRNSSKSLEGYEKQLLKEMMEHREAAVDSLNGSLSEQRKAHGELRQFQFMHEHLRKYYFDL